MIRFFAYLLVGLLFSPNESLAKPEKIRVGVTHFPPFYEITNDAPLQGLGIDVIDALNTVQTDYEFIPVPASPRRRHDMFAQGRFDMSFFDHYEWGWEKLDVEKTDVYLEGGEVYVTLKTPQVDQSFFDTLEDKSIAAILGYHYGFADYNNNPDALRKKFNITLTNDHEQILKMVLGGRVQVGVFTETYLARYFQRDFMARNRLLVSKRYDQRYNFITLVRKGFTPSANKIQDYMDKLRTLPEYQWLRDKYGIEW